MNKKIKPIVYRVLKENEYARNNDNYLIVKVSQELEPELAGGKFVDMIFSKVSHESITRARRQFFKENPELKPDKMTKIREKEEQNYFIEYGG